MLPALHGGGVEAVGCGRVYKLLCSVFFLVPGNLGEVDTVTTRRMSHTLQRAQAVPPPPSSPSV